jgi:hypothetical protein
MDVDNMMPTLTIPAKNFGSIGEHNKNCTVQFMRHLIIYCEDQEKKDYFMQFGTLKSFLISANKNMSSNGFLTFEAPLKYQR